MGKGLLDILLDQIFDSDWVGRRGEKLTERELRLVSFMGREGKILKNVYIPKDNGETSEIDVLFITQKGIFVIESKNYSGWIFGDEKSSYWTVMLPNKEKHKFYNPIFQNRSHVKWLSKYLNIEVPVFSLVVFSERCELKKVSVGMDDVHVIKRDQLYGTIRNIWDSTADYLNKEQMDEINHQLSLLTNVDQTLKTAHVESIKEKYVNNDENVVIESKTEEGKKVRYCPKCGALLILRTAKKGANAGNQFYGCSNFPACRFIENI